MRSPPRARAQTYSPNKARKICHLISQLGWPKAAFCCTQGCRTSQLQYKIQWLHALGHAQESGVLDSVAHGHLDRRRFAVINVPRCCCGCTYDLHCRGSFPVFWLQHIFCHPCRSASDLNIIAKYRKTHPAQFPIAKNGDHLHKLNCADCSRICCRDFSGPCILLAIGCLISGAQCGCGGCGGGGGGGGGCGGGSCNKCLDCLCSCCDGDSNGSGGNLDLSHVSTNLASVVELPLSLILG